MATSIAAGVINNRWTNVGLRRGAVIRRTCWVLSPSNIHDYLINTGKLLTQNPIRHSSSVEKEMRKAGKWTIFQWNQTAAAIMTQMGAEV